MCSSNNQAFQAAVRTRGNLSPITVDTNPVVLENTTGEALALLALAFGASALIGDVVLPSEHFGNALPAAATRGSRHTISSNTRRSTAIALRICSIQQSTLPRDLGQPAKVRRTHTALHPR